MQTELRGPGLTAITKLIKRKIFRFPRRRPDPPLTASREVAIRYNNSHRDHSGGAIVVDRAQSDQSRIQVRVEIPNGFEKSAEVALQRLKYLYPHATLSIVGSVIEGAADPQDASLLSREIHYALYRERIYAQTFPLREALVGAVTRR
jgi:hypothetical protein